MRVCHSATCPAASEDSTRGRVTTRWSLCRRADAGRVLAGAEYSIVRHSRGRRTGAEERLWVCCSASSGASRAWSAWRSPASSRARCTRPRSPRRSSARPTSSVGRRRARAGCSCPTVYVVSLGRPTSSTSAQWATQLADELADMVQEHIDDEGWSTSVTSRCTVPQRGPAAPASSRSPAGRPERRPPPPAVQLAVDAGGRGRRRAAPARRRRAPATAAAGLRRPGLRRRPGTAAATARSSTAATSRTASRQGYPAANGYAPPATVPRRRTSSSSGSGTC